MSAVAAAIGGAAVLGVGGAMIGASATRDAAQQQADAARNAAGLQYQMYEQQRQDQAPWRAAGESALKDMQNPAFQRDFSMQDFQQDPGYQFRMDQGQKALEASAAARGGLMGGNFGTALSQYGQNYASNEYQNAYNRFTNNQSNRFNRLASIAGIGQTANGQTAQAGMNAANNAGEAMMGGANAMAGAQIAQGQMWGNTLSSIGSQGANAWLTNQYMNRGMGNNYGGNSGAGYESSLNSLQSPTGPSFGASAPGGGGGGFSLE